MDEGTAMVLGAVESLDDEALADPVELPGWTRRHVIAHLAANADALTRLAGWARTGRENPMYSSPQQRADEIDAGSALPAAQLRRWLRESAATLKAALDALSGPEWSHEVITAQGRLVPATELPWLRAREVMVHAVDLAAGITFAGLPPDFTAALVDDVAAKRSRS
ncbi:MAG: maleylpyruvate isomerase family mycothiol-dependent enzyme, partial [Actinobacteria bacterium]|nr:maleylpyruvate isomerase family mycothiol-dependent enzyme [Actinomycetota bacterium]